MKQIININKDWLFAVKEISCEQQERFAIGEKINLPYAFSYCEGKIYSFKKEFTLTYPYKKAFLEFTECSGTSIIYVNSIEAGRHWGGYTIFRIEITDFLKDNQINTITIESQNNLAYKIPCSNGFIDSVNLVLTDKTHFELLDYGSKGIYLTTYLDGKNADISVKSLISGKIANSGAEYCIFDNSNQKVCLIHKPACSNTFVTTIYNVNLWDGVNSPYLYTLRARIFSLENDEIYDEVEIKFGVRCIHIDTDKGFFLNNKAYTLNGPELHHNNNSNKAVQKDIEYIKELGANSIKYCSDCVSNDFYALCDKEGIIVSYDLTFLPLETKNRQIQKQMRILITELIKQNYNHPSICFWTLEYNAVSEMNFIKIFFYRKLFNLIRKLDKNNLIINSQEKLLANFNNLYDTLVDSNLTNEGMFTVDRKRKKNDYYYYCKLKWTNKKFIHICSDNNQNTYSEQINLKILSRCHTISVYINGKHLRNITSCNDIFEIPINLILGENRITVNSELNCGDTIIINRLAKD